MILENPELKNRIKQVLKNRFQLRPDQVKRLSTSWFGETPGRPGKKNEYLQVLVEISKNAFFLGNLEIGYNSVRDEFYQGFIWIGKTRYEIWRV